MNTDQNTTIHPAVRAIIGIAVTIGAGFGALVAWFVGIITFTGCFISCGDPNELGGMGLMAIAAGLLGVVFAGLGYAFVGWSRERMIRLWLIGIGVGAIVGILSLIGS